MKTLLNLSRPDDLVDYDTDCSGVDIKYLRSSSVVNLVRHALVDCSIDLDIYKFTSLEGCQVVRHLNSSMFPESLGELRSGPCSVSFGICHTL